MPHRARRPRSRSFFALFAAFVRMIRGHRLIAILSLATVSVSTLVGLVPPYGIKLVIDYALIGHPMPQRTARWLPMVHGPRSLLATVALGMILLTLVSLAVGIWGRWHMTRASKRVTVEVRRRAFDHAVQLPLHRVHELKSGGLASILREDAGGVGNLLFDMVYNPWRAIIQLVGTLIILARVDWRMLVAAVALLPIVYMTHRTWIRRIRPLFRDIRGTRTQVDSHATEVFAGIRVVRGFGRQRTESAAFTRNNHLMARQELFAWWWMRGIDAAWTLLIPTASALLLWYGGLRVVHDQEAVKAGTLAAGQALSVGDLMMFMTYLTWLLGPLATLAGSATGLQNGLAGLDRVLDLLQEEPEVPQKPGALHLAPREVAGRLVVRDLSFTYPRGQSPVLQNIAFEAPARSTIALVGPSGAGKSTLCNLVARFYDPSAGAILLDGHDLRDLDVRSYRRLLGIVEQEVFLFDGTVAQNIAYGRRREDRPAIEAAARQANAHEFICQLDKGYDTWIGERGVKLSGGQRQRLSIARALLADPRILILDEATSNLDTHSEQLIQQALHTLFAQRTTFVIAHRLSTVQNADLILVLDGGRIIERGIHPELMASGGMYCEMVERQQSSFADRTLPTAD